MIFYSTTTGDAFATAQRSHANAKFSPETYSGDGPPHLQISFYLLQNDDILISLGPALVIHLSSRFHLLILGNLCVSSACHGVDGRLCIRLKERPRDRATTENVVTTTKCFTGASAVDMGRQNPTRTTTHSSASP